MRLESGSVRVALFAGWTGIATIVIWLTLVQSSDSSRALTAGVLFVVCLVLSRFVLGLSFASAPMLYLTLLGFVHLGIVVPWALGIYDVSRITWFVPYGLSHALTLITYSILVYQTGLIVAVGGTRQATHGHRTDGPYFENPRLFLAGASLFAIGVTMFVTGWVRLDPDGYYRLTYSDTFRLRAESDPRLFGSGMTFALIGLTLAMAGAPRRRFRIVLWAAALWFLLLFYLGFRGPALIASLIVCAAALKRGVQFPRWLPWVVATLLLVAFPIMHIVRDQPFSERFTGISLSDFNVLDGPVEIGASIRPLVETCSLIGPEGYRYGETYLLGLKGILPNLAIRWEAPATESMDDLPPGHWITAMVDPWAYKNYGGIGFSAVAEPYMNFGLAGVVGYFLLLGFLLVRLEQVSIRSSHALACWALVLGPLLWTTRNDFTNFFRPAAWGLICIGVAWFFCRDRALMPKPGRREGLPL
ncbi:MAG: O-antigen polysaccharide polymerase Wzy [Candidatus Acidiferrales bacterium]